MIHTYTNTYIHTHAQKQVFGRHLEPGEYLRLPGDKRRKLEQHVIKLFTQAARRPKTAATTGQNTEESTRDVDLRNITTNSNNPGMVNRDSSPVRIVDSPGPGHYDPWKFDQLRAAGAHAALPDFRNALELIAPLLLS